MYANSLFKKLSMSALILVMAMAFSVTAFGQVQKAPTRDEIADQYKWDLTDFYPSDEAWEQDMKLLEERIPEMDAYKGRLSESPEIMAECLMKSDTLNMLAHRLYVYAALMLDSDNSVGKYQEMRMRIYGLFNKLEQAGSYINPEILKMDNAKLEEFLKYKDLQVYAFNLKDLVRQKEHIMSEDIEEVLSMAQTVTSGPGNIFQMIDDADITFPNVKDEDGNEIELTPGRYSQLLRSEDREVRRNASNAYNDTYLKYENGLGACLSASVNGDVFYTRARKYNSSLERSLDANNIPVSVYHNLIETAGSNLEPLHKYVALRKEFLGVDTLFGFDMYVPLVSNVETKVSFEEGRKIVLDAMKVLGKDYVKNLEKAFDSRWIDVYETDGKGSGAYSWGTYTVHPVVLLNYSDQLDDVFTLGHELGHCMHSLYSYKAEPYPYVGHSLFTAEVASTCNETILIHYMLDRAKTREEKLYLLNHYIEMIMGTFYTQIFFSEFEHKIHEHVEAGGALSAENMRQMYREVYQKYFGPDYFIPENRDLGCLRIGHFYRMYYVYQYATSFAASQMLAARILDGDKKATDDYIQFIKTGSSDYPINILKKAGVDMTTPEPVENVINIFGELVDEFEKLLLEK